MTRNATQHCTDAAKATSRVKRRQRELFVDLQAARC